MNSVALSRYVISVGIIACCNSVFANTASCFAQASTALERAYCEIQAEGIAGLPPFADFKKNPPATQQLLLKRPAKRAGVKLPSIQQTKKKVKPAVPPKAAPPKKSSSRLAVSAEKQSGVVSSPSQRLAESPSLGKCSLSQTRITCSGVMYDLINNHALPRDQSGDILTSTKLSFPSAPGAQASTEEVNRYLAETYERYIRGMTTIGLAGSTLSYTRFYYLYQDIRQQKLDFAERFEEMFRYLKRDKAQMGVKKRYGQPHPASIDQCMRLGVMWIVCDKNRDNWVYRRQE